MQIGINLLYLIPSVVGGTETYARNLIRTLLGQIKKNDELFIFCNRESAATFESVPKLKIVILPINSENRIARIIAEQILLPVYCWKKRIDVLLSLGYTQPLLMPCKSIVAIHDLNWRYHPQDFGFISRQFLRYLVTMSAKRASAIIAISRSTKRSLVQHLSINPKKISVIYLGMTQSVPNSLNRNKVRQKFSLPQKYLFTVLSHYPHKNLTTLVRAFIAVQKDENDLHLVIAGTGTGEAKSIRTKYLQRLGNSHIHQLPFLSDSELAVIYQESIMFIFPSAYEGFGLPVLEAMSHKTPVVSSNAYALKEVVGSGGILVDPYNVKQYIIAIKKLLSSSKLRQKYIRAGTERVNTFTWDKCGKETIELIRRVYGSE